MIISVLIYILSFLINSIALLLPVWQVWPDSFLQAVNSLFGYLSIFNFLLPVDKLCQVIIFVITFDVAYFSAKLLMKILNYFRGAGSGLDL